MAAFGFIYASKRILPEYLPLDENHPSRPHDPYGLSKLVGEQIADSLALLHADMTISSLRFPGVVFDRSYESVRERWQDPGARAKTSWAYIDARDFRGWCPCHYDDWRSSLRRFSRVRKCAHGCLSRRMVDAITAPNSAGSALAIVFFLCVCSRRPAPFESRFLAPLPSKQLSS